MKRILNLLLLVLMNVGNIQSQKDHYSEYFLPNQLDSYQNKVLIVGYEINEGLSIYLKNENDTLFKSISKEMDLELNIESKVHFDNFGNIWAFGKQNIWKYENGVWKNILTNSKIMQNRYFLDFCFDNENNLYVSTRIEFVRYRENIGGTMVKVLDSINHELLKINTNSFDFEVLLKLYDNPLYNFGAISAITKRPDGAIVCYRVGTSNNLFIYNDGVVEYKTVPIYPDGLRTIVSSISYDLQMNLWISVTSMPEFKKQAVSNGVHKISSSNQQTSWDTSTGISSKLFSEYFTTNTILGVNKVICDNKTGLVWCGTDYGYFSIDEFKSGKQQIATYNGDSIVGIYKKTIIREEVQSYFNILDIALSAKSVFFIASQWALLETHRNIVTSTKNEIIFSISPLQLDVIPNPVIGNDMKILIKNADFIEDIQLRIIDVTGRTVHICKISHLSREMEIPINIKDFRRGAYFVIINSGTIKLTKKIIIN